MEKVFQPIRQRYVHENKNPFELEPEDELRVVQPAGLDLINLCEGILPYRPVRRVNEER